MKRRKVFTFATLFAACLLLSSCASKSTAPEAVQMTHAAAAMADSAGNSADYAAEQGIKTEAVTDAMSGEAQGLTTASGSLDSASLDRKLIRTVDLTAETTEFDKLMQELSSKVSQLGGYVENSHIEGTRIYGDGEAAAKYATITVRVPADKVDQLVTVVDQNSNIIAKSESASDVTLQYADLESRKKSYLIEQDRLWALLEKAENVEVILSLETRLTEIRYNLESMESQLKLYDNQVNYSTINMNIEEVIKLTEEPKAPATTAMDRMKTGFADNMERVANAFANLFVGIVAGLPYLIVLAVIGAGGFAVYRIYKKRQDAGFFKKKEDSSHEKEE